MVMKISSQEFEGHKSKQAQLQANAALYGSAQEHC